MFSCFLQIRLQYEKYPEHTEQASRLVVLVQDVEIRDRLAHSQINKFLYQYTSEACPNQSHANMVRALCRVVYVWSGGQGGERRGKCHQILIKVFLQ